VAAEEVVDGPTGAARFVTDRIAEGVDYIKLIVYTPGPDQEILDALVAAAHRHGKLNAVHDGAAPAFGDDADSAARHAHRVHCGSVFGWAGV